MSAQIKRSLDSSLLRFSSQITVQAGGLGHLCTAAALALLAEAQNRIGIMSQSLQRREREAISVVREKDTLSKMLLEKVAQRSTSHLYTMDKHAVVLLPDIARSLAHCRITCYTTFFPTWMTTRTQPRKKKDATMTGWYIKVCRFKTWRKPSRLRRNVSSRSVGPLEQGYGYRHWGSVGTLSPITGLLDMSRP
jgi:hypothetical protein